MDFIQLQYTIIYIYDEMYNDVINLQMNQKINNGNEKILINTEQDYLKNEENIKNMK